MSLFSFLPGSQSKKVIKNITSWALESAHVCMLSIRGPSITTSPYHPQTDGLVEISLDSRLLGSWDSKQAEAYFPNAPLFPRCLIFFFILLLFLFPKIKLYNSNPSILQLISKQW